MAPPGVARISTGKSSKRQYPLDSVVASNDGFAKAKAIENKQELVVEHAQELVKDGRSERLRPGDKGWARTAGQTMHLVARITCRPRRMTPTGCGCCPQSSRTARSSASSQARCWANRCAEPGISKEARPNVEELTTTLPVAISVSVKHTLTARHLGIRPAAGHIDNDGLDSAVDAVDLQSIQRRRRRRTVVEFGHQVVAQLNRKPGFRMSVGEPEFAQPRPRQVYREPNSPAAPAADCHRPAGSMRCSARPNRARRQPGIAVWQHRFPGPSASAPSPAHTRVTQKS